MSQLSARFPDVVMKSVQRRIITTSGRGPAARDVSFPLVQSRNGQYLEAKVDSRALPASIVAKIKLKADAPEYHFDFSFTEFSKQPPAVAAPALAAAKAPARTSLPAAPGTAVAAAPSEPTSPTPSQGPIVNPALIQVAIPGTVGEIVAEISARNRQIGELIELGRFTDVWFPAFEAKDLALAMSPHAAQIPADKRALLEPTINQLLRAAWLLDAFGDLGNREQITAAYADFKSAVAGIESIARETR